ncbi:MAG: DUF3298 domain-containing protein [Clostridia bacterium]|nr:DUF3298 domain-containing protein [Clostridia bacterium]MBR5902756.1 DUF3298 domain-containing protein [Clostridia bacterium]
MKKLLAVILILCLAFCFACGKKDKQNDTTGENPGSTSGDTTTDTPDTPNGGNDKPSGGADSGNNDPAGSGSSDAGNTQPEPQPEPLAWTDRIFTGTFTDEKVTNDPLVMLTVYLPKVTASDDIELYYQGRLDRIKEQAQTTYLDLGRDNYQIASQGIGIFVPVTVEHGYKVLRNDGLLFSVRREIYENTGGAHPNITVASETFRVSDGALMIFSDLFTVGYDDALARIRPIIESQMDAKIKEYGEAYYYENAKADLFNMWDKSGWYLTEDSLIMYWQTYDISPYAAGLQEFVIPLSQIADIFDAQWIS